MNNNWIQIIGTFLIGGALLNWILALYFSMFTMIAKPQEVNEICITLGGKINRKWFFFNNLIYLITLTILAFITFIFKNWVMFIIVIPYFIALYILYWGNIYKRINAIANNHTFAKFFTIFIAIFVLCLNFIHKTLPENFNAIIEISLIIFWLLVFVLPTRKNKETDIIQ